MSDSVIRVEYLSKRYVLGGRANNAARYDTFRDAMVRAVKRRFVRPSRTIDPKGKKEDNAFWALKDVSFQVKRGEVLGIIGRNGAGKSTLLKILSRITEPTAGRVAVRGRVASLLEVGTGFHPELSGRENIFLNGVILGMTRAEVKARFDEIVAFAEVEKFLDTPVKHYSSGMYVRLAFAVAAHLDPEILIVDEVLAVGDAAFQEKCLGRIRDTCRDDGRTVVFVSHNAGALLGVCTRGLWLKDGQVALESSIKECLAQYGGAGTGLRAEFEGNAADRPAIRSVELDEAALRLGDLVLRVGFTSPFPLKCAVVGAVVHNRFGQPLFGANGRMIDSWTPPSATEGVIECRLEGVPLCNDSYRISVWLGDATQDYDSRLDALSFEFLAQPLMRNATDPRLTGSMWLPWTFRWASAG